MDLGDGSTAAGIPTSLHLRVHEPVKHPFLRMSGGGVRSAIAFEGALPKNHSAIEKMIPRAGATVVIEYLLISICRM
jgi:hypothetical protein